MRLSIRLQNHGKKNHPYWRIVVAPQHKNIFGRYTDHIGFWSPRHNINIKRQVIFNLPRLMYWLGQGAIPTYKIHKFLHMFGLFPKPWQYVKSAVELAEQAKKQKPYEQLTPKEKSLVDRRRKRQERQQLQKNNFHRYEAYAMRENKLAMQMLGKHQDNEFENKVIRDVLHQTDFQKYDRLAELSGNSFSTNPSFKKLKEIKEKLRKYKSELALLDKQYANSRIIIRSKLVEKINGLTARLNDFQVERAKLNLPQNPVNQEEYVTEDYLTKKLKYQLITKRFQKSQQQLKLLDKLFEPITVKQLADKFEDLKKRNIEKFKGRENLYELAEETFKAQGQEGLALTRLDLLAMEPEYRQVVYGPTSKQIKNNPNSGSHKEILKMIMENEISVPSVYPVHPRPDLKTYIPQQHYDPIDVNKLDIMMMDSLEPHQELQKYLRKRNPEQSIEQRKKRDSNKRMQRLRLLTQG